MFDIIPPGKVMPSASSRPVITHTSPEQLDNTLAAKPSTAPLIGGHRAANKPAADGDAISIPDLPIDDAGPLSPPEVPDLDAALGVAGKPRKVLTPSSSSSGTEASPVPDIVPPTNGEPEAAEKPAPESQTPEAAELKLDVPSGAETETQPDKPASAQVPEADNGSLELKADEPMNDEPAKPEVADDSVAAVLAADAKADSSSPQEHSPALKHALKELDEQPEEAHHHELYGGKPVIVVHKPHRAGSVLGAIAWFIICLILAAVVVDLLIDAGYISIPYDIPTTHFFQ